MVAAFGVSYASTVVLGGRLGDNLGRRRVLRIGLVWFGAASVWCALAPSAGLLVAARVAQGLGAALVAPQVLSTIQAGPRGPQSQGDGVVRRDGGHRDLRRVHRGRRPGDGRPRRAGLARGLLARRPLVAAALLACGGCRSRGPSSPHRVDTVGTALLVVAVVLVVLPLTEGRAAGWPWWTWTMLVGVRPGARRVRVVGVADGAAAAVMRSCRPAWSGPARWSPD